MEAFALCAVSHGEFLGWRVWCQEVDWVIPVGSLQLGLLCASLRLPGGAEGPENAAPGCGRARPKHHWERQRCF